MLGTINQWGGVDVAIPYRHVTLLRTNHPTKCQETRVLTTKHSAIYWHRLDKLLNWRHGVEAKHQYCPHGWRKAKNKFRSRDRRASRSPKRYYLYKIYIWWCGTCTLLHHKAYTARGYRSKIQMCMHNNVFFFIFIFLCILVPGYLFTSRLPCHLSLVTFLKAESWKVDSNF